MGEYSMTFVTTANEDEARRIAKRLVEGAFAACVQITGPVLSTYVWEGKLCESRETMVIAKSRTARRKDIEREVRLEHSYETPEIVHVAIEDGDPAYLAWVSLRTTPRS